MLERLRQECYNKDNDTELYLYKVSDEYGELYSYGIYEDLYKYINEYGNNNNSEEE